MRQLDLCLELPGDDHELLIFPSALAASDEQQQVELWLRPRRGEGGRLTLGGGGERAWHVVGRRLLPAGGGWCLAHGVMPLLQAKLRSRGEWGAYHVGGGLLVATQGGAVLMVRVAPSFAHVDVWVRCEAAAAATTLLAETVLPLLESSAEPMQVRSVPLCPQCVFESSISTPAVPEAVCAACGLPGRPEPVLLRGESFGGAGS